MKNMRTFYCNQETANFLSESQRTKPPSKWTHSTRLQAGASLASLNMTFEIENVNLNVKIFFMYEVWILYFLNVAMELATV